MRHGLVLCKRGARPPLSGSNFEGLQSQTPRGIPVAKETRDIDRLMNPRLFKRRSLILAQKPRALTTIVLGDDL